MQRTRSRSRRCPKDEIQVVGHVDLSGGSITNFFVTQHYSSSYLYAERGSGKPVMLLDVSKPDKPLFWETWHTATKGPGA